MRESLDIPEDTLRLADEMGRHLDLSVDAVRKVYQLAVDMTHGPAEGILVILLAGAFMSSVNTRDKESESRTLHMALDEMLKIAHGEARTCRMQ